MTQKPPEIPLHKPKCISIGETSQNSATMSADKIPLIDFSGMLSLLPYLPASEILTLSAPDFYSPDPSRKQKVVDQIRESCLYNGFFQIANHTVPLQQQQAVMNSAKRLFALDLEEKQKVAKENNTWNRGYEMLRSQILEEGTQPELKEGFYIGDDISTDHPYFIEKKLNSGPNQWPQILGEEFKQSTMDYYKSTLNLAADLLKALALSLDLQEDYFTKFLEGAVATMRLLHYPSQSPDADEKLTRGIGAHTDFGAITLLLQDEVDGLQVWDKHSSSWIDVSSGPFSASLASGDHSLTMGTGRANERGTRGEPGQSDVTVDK